MILSICLNSSLDTRHNIIGFAAGKLYEVPAPHITAGGKGFNLARVAALLGADVFAAGPVGSVDRSFFEHELKSVGVKPHLISTDHPTRRCLNIVDTSTGKSTQVLESGFTLRTGDLDELLEMIERLATCAKVVCASGSVPPGMPEDIYSLIGEVARRNECLYLLDARGIHLAKGLASQPFAVKPNRWELEEYAGRELSSHADFKTLLTELYEYVQLPIVSLGQAGALFLWQGEVLCAIEHPALQPKNAVGAGDAFMAGLAYSLDAGLDPWLGLKYAAACGMSNAIHEETGFVVREEVIEFMHEVNLKVLD